MQILLGHIVLIGLDPLVIPRQKYPVALAFKVRLYYKGLGTPIIELHFEGWSVIWQNPCLREEVVLLWNQLLHGQQILRQQVFPGQVKNCR